MTERRIGDHGDAVLRAPRNHGVLDRALLQMVEYLVTGDLALAGDRQQFVKIVGIEIADAPAADFPGAGQFLERGDGFIKRIRTAPMQQVTIEPVGVQPRQ